MGETNTGGTNADTPPFWVICLCAEWCNVCCEWRNAFNAEASAHTGVHFAWVDIEDEAEEMGEFDVETFPTVLVARGDQPLFLGPIPPSGAQLSRLIRRLMQEATDEAVTLSPVSAQAASLLKRLQGSVLPKP